MDAETRHELKQNELARAIDRIRSFDDDRIRYVLIGLAVLLFLVAGFRWWQYSQRTALEAEWKQLTQVEQALGAAKDAAALETSIATARDLAARGSTDSFRAYARMVIAAGLWEKIAKDPGNTKQYLPQIRDELSQIVGKSSTPPGVNLSATYSLANVCESMRDLEQAKRHYESIVANPAAEGSAFKSLAQFRLGALDNLKTPVKFEPGNAPLPAAPIHSDELPPANDYSIETINITPGTTDEPTDDSGQEEPQP